MNWQVPKKADGRLDLTPRRHHGFSFFVMLCGFLLPPLAVAARFGIGRDFFINCVCTICGYIPGHGHNFFIQNIRNNENQNRTPKWAKRYGLVSDDNDKAVAKKRAWVGRYNDQTATRQMYDDDGNVYTYDRSHRFEDGDKPGAAKARTRASSSQGTDGEQFYGNNGRSSSSASGSNLYGEDGAERSSLRRSKSKSSIRSFGRRSAPEHDMLPGAAEADRRKTGGKRLGLLSRKGKADRHARSERVMHDSDYGQQQHRNPYDDASLESFNQNGDGDGGARGYGDRRGSFDDGPENADDTVGKRYARSGAVASEHRNNNYDPLLHTKGTPGKPQEQKRVVDIMNDDHQF